jgi:hypothetical protein
MNLKYNVLTYVRIYNLIFFGGDMSTISNAASSATSTVTNFFSSALNRVGQFAGRIWTMMTNIVPSAVSSKVSKLFAPVTNVVKSMPKPIKAVFVATAMCSVGVYAYRCFKSKQNAKKEPSAAESLNQSAVVLSAAESLNQSAVVLSATESSEQNSITNSSSLPEDASSATENKEQIQGAVSDSVVINEDPDQQHNSHSGQEV